MLNIHTHLLDLVKNKIINTSEFFILLLICKRINIKSQSFPSIKTLMEESGFGKTKIEECLSNLQKKNFLEKKQRRVKLKNGREVNSSNLYTIKTNLVSVFVNLKNHELEEKQNEIKEISATVFQGADNQGSENQPLSINHSPLSINQSIEEREKESEVVIQESKVVKANNQSTSFLNNSKSFEITPNEVVQVSKEITKELIATKLNLDQGEPSERDIVFKIHKTLNNKKTTIDEFNQILDNPPKFFESNKFSSMSWGGWVNEIKSKNLLNKKEKETKESQNALKTILTTENVLFSEYAKEFWQFSEIEENGHSKEQIYIKLNKHNLVPNYSKYQNLINEFYKNKTNQN